MLQAERIPCGRTNPESDKAVIQNNKPIAFGGDSDLCRLIRFCVKRKICRKGDSRFSGVCAVALRASILSIYIILLQEKSNYCGVGHRHGGSAALAVLLTPLDRYVGFIYSYMNWCSVFLGGVLYIVFYFAAFAAAKKKRA